MSCGIWASQVALEVKSLPANSEVIRDAVSITGAVIREGELNTELGK